MKHETSGTPLPLHALLSQVLVAYTLEFDNAFERDMPHRTTDYPTSAPAGAPWLVSMVMWTGCLRFIPEDGIDIATLAPLTRRSPARLKLLLKRLGRWWGYLHLDHQGIVRPTPYGLQAQQIWSCLPSLLDTNWRSRFGDARVDQLLASLRTLWRQIDPHLPDWLPTLGYGLTCAPPEGSHEAAATMDNAPAEPQLAGMVSRLLLAFALEFERTSPVSLAICANVLRLAEGSGASLRSLPQLAGVSSESIGMASRFLEAKHYAVRQRAADAKAGKMLRLTRSGEVARAAHGQITEEIEQGWEHRFGADAVVSLRAVLQDFGEAEQAGESLLLRGTIPPPECWRAKLPLIRTLPHFPMVLHRGGFPDGA